MQGQIYSSEIQQNYAVASLAIIIENLATFQEAIHAIHLNTNQKSFPITYRLEKLEKIKRNGEYLLFVLLFGNPHRLLFESSSMKKHLKFNDRNYINFTVHSVCEY